MKPLSVSVNGELTELPPAATVATMLLASGLDRAPCAVEVNEKLIPKRDHDAHELHEGDRIEIVTLVGGG